jgi:aspartyl/asparaginyl-tRNA synthetase
MTSIVDRLRQGASVKVTGTLTASLGAEQPVELRADALEILGACDAEVCVFIPGSSPMELTSRSCGPKTYPLGPLSKHGAERSVTHLRDVAHLRMRDPEQQAAIKLRDRVGRAWRDYFEVHYLIVCMPLDRRVDR